jgi:CRP-like cAMP-binding protein
MLEKDHLPLRIALSLWLDAPLIVETLPPRRKLVQAGRRCDELFVIHSGWLVAFTQLSDGGRQIFNFWLPGEVFGVEFIAFRTAPYCVASMTACRIARVSREAVANTAGNAGTALAALACSNSLMLRERIVSLGRRNAVSRVVHLLLELTLRGRIASGSDDPLPLTQLEVADSTGLTATYVNRIFRRMRDRGQLDVSRHGLRLLDVDTLMREVQFNRAYLGGEPCIPTPAAVVTA